MKYALLLGVILNCTLISAQDLDLEIDLFADGFSQPVEMKHVGDDRLFVVEKTGRIQILNLDGTTEGTPFLDISGSVSNGGEQGLLSVAFHPDYNNNGFFYVNYTKNNGDTRVSRFTVDPGDPNIADAGSELVIIEYAQPFGNHNGGCLQFGPDGYLYIASGDGGSGGDPGNRAQNTTLLLGKLLRLDIDNPEGGNNYGIPNDNPFAGSNTDAEEIWAYGLRNPWKFSFDLTEGEIWIADVGQNAVEEVNRADLTAPGLNYGWRCYEGTEEFNTNGCPDPSELTFPVAEYAHAGGTANSIVGGYVYRGSDSPDLQGYYFYSDTYRNFIGAVDSDNNNEIYTGFGGTWVSFGQDRNNELYIISIGGQIYRISGQLLNVADNALDSTISIYPNPASERLNLVSNSAGLTEVRILDLGGSVVQQLQAGGTDRLELDVRQLATGMYFVQVSTDRGQQFTEKIIIQ